MGDGFLVSQIAACQYDPPPTTPPATPSTRSSRFLTVTPSLTFVLFFFVQNPKCVSCMYMYHDLPCIIKHLQFPKYILLQIESCWTRGHQMGLGLIKLAPLPETRTSPSTSWKSYFKAKIAHFGWKISAVIFADPVKMLSSGITNPILFSD